MIGFLRKLTPERGFTFLHLYGRYNRLLHDSTLRRNPWLSVGDQTMEPDLSFLDRAPSLTGVSIHDGFDPSAADLFRHGDLRVLEVRGADLPDPSPFAALVDLEGHWSEDVADGLRRLRQVRQLELHGFGHQDLSALSHLPLTSLWLEAPNLRRFGGEFPSIRSLELHSITKVDSIDDIAAQFPNVQQLSLAGLRKISDLSPLAGLTKVTILKLPSLNRVDSLEPLTAMKDLVALELPDRRFEVADGRPEVLDELVNMKVLIADRPSLRGMRRDPRTPITLADHAYPPPLTNADVV